MSKWSRVIDWRRMGRWRMIGIAVAVVAVALSLLNASWLAPTPKGRLTLVAHRGVAQQFDRTGLGPNDCSATKILPPDHNYIENTIRSIEDAGSFGTNIVELDVHPTTDGRMVVFHDLTLDCRTDGHGAVRDHSLAQLKALDVGYGYTADGGKTFPLRGRGIGLMPTVEEVLAAVPRRTLLFSFKSRDPREADLLAAAFRRAGVKLDETYSFYGDEAVLGRMRRLAPRSWIWSKAGAKACASDYLKWGWIGHVPASCRNGTIVVPLNYQWAIWGWPNRFLDRMAKAKARVIVMAELEEDGPPVGLDQPEQLGQVPRGFRGYLWVEDIYTVGRSLGR